MLKFTALFFLAVITLAASHVSYNIDKIKSSGDPNFDRTYKKFIRSLEEFHNYYSKSKGETSVFSIFIRSVDMQCMKDNNKLHNFQKYYKKHSDRISELGKGSSDEKDQLFILHFVRSFRCTKKLRQISDLVFKSFALLSDAAQIIKDEPELAMVRGYLRCANNYAVTNNMWDIKKYPVDYEMEDFEAAQCESMKEMVEEVFDVDEEGSGVGEDLRSLDTECSRKMIKEIVDFIFKSVLFLQVQMTHEQSEREIKTFYDGLVKFYDENFVCLYDIITSFGDEYKLERMMKNRMSKFQLRR